MSNSLLWPVILIQSSLSPKLIRLQEELRLKDALLEWCIRTKQEKAKAHEDALDLLAKKEFRKLKEELKFINELMEKAAGDEKVILERYEVKLSQRKMEVQNLQEELKLKEELLEKAVQKRWKRTKAHVETLDLLAKLREELKVKDEFHIRAAEKK
ncbi:Hypothetical predicted protein [Xyrichtys novacula]|uniref:Uncharacterized protein n=1 Tax=Xyrichtys novacula TaxID=13765 RepID=A0AAV1GA36_XYRNO|nr:Hypothetical predicted protein [Xyrichtys novacula]